VSALTIAPAVRPWEASLEMITRVTMRYSANRLRAAPPAGSRAADRSPAWRRLGVN